MQESTAKRRTEKYDRQIRLWGPKGQRRLSEAVVGILGCEGSSIEASKNLVLPGVKEIHIYDDRLVGIQDLGTSFFYQQSSIGKPRALEAAANLLEMNPDVKGTGFNVSTTYLLQNSELLKQYQLLICTNLDEKVNSEYSRLCESASIPVIFMTVVGYLVYVRNQASNHYIDSEPGRKFYLRLNNPFQELEKYQSIHSVYSMIAQYQKAKSENKNEEQIKAIAKTLCQVPYPLILIAVNSRQTSENRSKKAIQGAIDFLMGQLDSEHSANLDNFRQAKSRAIDLFQNVGNYLNNPDIFQTKWQTDQRNKEDSMFFQFLNACGDYIKEFKSLPQPLRLPDMNTSTEQYLKLKAIYKTHHLKCRDVIVNKMQNKNPKLEQSELKKAVEDYINNIEVLCVVNMRPYYKELISPDISSFTIQEYDPEPEASKKSHYSSIYFAMKAASKFKSLKGYWPQNTNLQQMQDIVMEMKKQYQLAICPVPDERYLKQICRCQGHSNISISSISGAMAAQEGIKLISHCFQPVKGFVFDGITSEGAPISC